MRNLRKVLAIVVALVLVLGTALPVMAATSNEVATYAQNLYNLGLYAGVDPSTYVPALDSQLTREQAFVLYAKIMGKAAKASAVTADNIKAYLTDVFVDANQFSDWAKPYATVLIMDKDISGRGDFTMGPQDIITGTELGVLMLKAMKVPVDYSTSMNSLVTLWNMKVLTFAEMAELNNAQLTRGDAIVIFYKTIANGVIKNGEYVAKDLVNKGVMSESSARAIGLLTAFDNNSATNAANAATVAAEAAVTAVETAPYATEADFNAFVTKVTDAKTKIAAAPAATQTAFTTRVNVKNDLVTAAVNAQVVAATAKVDTYCAITAVANVEASTAAIAKKDAANTSIAAIIDASKRPALQARVDATKAVLEATKLVDITTGDNKASAAVRGDGVNEVLMTIQLKDAFGTILSSAPATTVELSVAGGGAISSSEVTLYNGIGTALFAASEVEDEDVIATVTGTVAAGNYAAGAKDTFKVTMTAAPAPDENELVSAAMSANQTDRIVLTFESAIDDEDVVFDGGDISDDDVADITTSANKATVYFDPAAGLDFESGEEYTVSVDGVEADFTVTDTQKPFITGVSINEDDYTQVLVTFSEPIILTGSEKAYLNGAKEADTYETDGNVLVLDFDDEYLSDGSANVTVNANSVQDFTMSANVNAAQTKSFVIAEPDVEIDASVTSYSPKMFAIELSSDCYVDVDGISIEKYNYDTADWDVLDGAAYGITAVNDDEVIVEFTDVIDNYFNKDFRVVIAEDSLMDVASGVTNDEITLDLDGDVMTEEDEDAPELDGFTAESDETGLTDVEISFSEPVVEPIVEDDMVITFIELDEDGEDEGTTVVINDPADISWDDYRMVATVEGVDLEAGTAYRVEIDGVVDDCGNDADTLETATFVTEDVEAPEAAHQLVSATVDGTVITLTFDKDLAVTDNNATNALYLGNYRYDAGAGYTYFDVDATTIEMTDSNVVVITTDDAIVGLSEIIVSDFMPSDDGSAFEDDDARTAVVEDIGD